MLKRKMKNIRSKVKVQYKNLNTEPGRKLSNHNVPKQQNIKVKVKKQQNYNGRNKNDKY